jgi:hypothetical protein
MTGGLGLDRRALLQRVLLLAGAAVLPGGAEALAAATQTGPHLLAAPRYALLTAVADTIVPKTDTVGAVEVGVPQHVDALLRNWAAPGTRDALVGALDAIDASAQRSNGKGFAALTPEERHAVLTAHDAAALKPPVAGQAANPLARAPAVADPKTGKLKQEVPQSLTSMGPPVVDPAYAKLKELIVVLYYYSEPALTQELPYEHSPGEWIPSVPVTPDTRPSGGAAFI